MSDKIDDICRDFLFLLANQTFQTDCCNLLEQLLKIFEIERWCCQITVKIPFILMTVGYWGNMYTNLFKFSEELFCSLTVVFLIETIQEYFPPNSFFFFFLGNFPGCLWEARDAVDLAGPLGTLLGSAAPAWASLAQRSPASSVLAREGAGYGSVGDVPGAWLASAPLSPSLWT